VAVAGVQVQAVRLAAVAVLAVAQAGQEPLLGELLHLVKVMLGAVLLPTAVLAAAVQAQ